MSGIEVQVIEGAFALAVGLMAAGVAWGWATGRWLREASPRIGRVAPPGIVPVDLLGVVVVAAVYFSFHWMALQGLADKDPASPITAAGVAVSMVVQIMIAATVVAMVAPRCGPVGFFGLRWTEWPWLLLIGPVAVAVVWVLVGGLQLAGYFRWMQERLGAPSLQDSVELLRESRDPAVLGLLTVAAVVVAPACEELVFRGYVYPVVKRYGGAWPAAAGSALLFAVAHNHPVSVLPLFLLGLILVAAYELTSSLWAPVAVHLCFNSLTVGLTALARVFNIPLEAP